MILAWILAGVDQGGVQFWGAVLFASSILITIGLVVSSKWLGWH